MKKITEYTVEQHFLEDDGVYPNSQLPVLIYRNVLKLPALFPATFVRLLFRKNNWFNAWDYGIFEYHHYHSIAHEVLGIYRGSANLQLGGKKGIVIEARKNDVIIIPAGVAHKNLDKETQLKCIGAYPDGSDYDINYGHPGERPQTDRNIRKIPKPELDPVFGKKGGILKFW
jgi:uncharacterized protein YjlB